MRENSEDGSDRIFRIFYYCSFLIMLFGFVNYGSLSIEVCIAMIPSFFIIFYYPRIMQNDRAFTGLAIGYGVCMVYYIFNLLASRKNHGESDVSWNLVIMISVAAIAIVALFFMLQKIELIKGISGIVLMAAPLILFLSLALYSYPGNQLDRGYYSTLHIYYCLFLSVMLIILFFKSSIENSSLAAFYLLMILGWNLTTVVVLSAKTNNPSFYREERELAGEIESKGINNIPETYGKMMDNQKDRLIDFRTLYYKKIVREGSNVSISNKFGNPGGNFIKSEYTDRFLWLLLVELICFLIVYFRNVFNNLKLLKESLSGLTVIGLLLIMKFPALPYHRFTYFGAALLLFALIQVFQIIRGVAKPKEI